MNYLWRISMHINSSASSHDIRIDRLKVFAAFLVVLQHSISATWTSYAPDTFTWKITNFIFILSRSAVVLFFMCSGAGMLKREHSIEEVLKKNILRLLKVYLGWMLIYGFFDSLSLLQQGLGSFRTIINAFLKCILFGKYHTWFIFALIGLYLITPFLSSITESRKNMRYFILLSLIFNLLFPLLTQFPQLDRLMANLANLNIPFVSGYILYYITGYYISKIEWKRSYSLTAVFGLIISYLAAYLYSTHISVVQGGPYQAIYDEFGICGFLIAVSVFSLFQSSKPLRENRLCTCLLQSGIGIYLLHPLLLPLFDGFKGLSRIAAAIFLYLISALICYFISQVKVLRNLFLKS